MLVLEATQIDAVAGAGPFSGISFGLRVLDLLYSGVNAAGATLRNYYGDDGALAIIAAGNMSA